MRYLITYAKNRHAIMPHIAKDWPQYLALNHKRQPAGFSPLLGEPVRNGQKSLAVLAVDEETEQALEANKHLEVIGKGATVAEAHANALETNGEIYRSVWPESLTTTDEDGNEIIQPLPPVFLVAQ